MRFFINIGLKNNLNTVRLIGIINEHTQNRNIEIGKIDIMRKFSFFEVDKSYEKDILNAFKDADFEGEKLIVEVSKPEGSFKSKEGFYAGKDDFPRKKRSFEKRNEEPRKRNEYSDRRSDRNTDYSKPKKRY